MKAVEIFQLPQITKEMKRMHWKEYEELTGTEVTQEAYKNFIEPMYEAVGLDKGD